MQEVGKVKIDLQSTQTKLENERTVQKDLRDKLADADTKLSGMVVNKTAMFTTLEEHKLNKSIKLMC